MDRLKYPLPASMPKLIAYRAVREYPQFGAISQAVGMGLPTVPEKVDMGASAVLRPYRLN